MLMNEATDDMLLLVLAHLLVQVLPKRGHLGECMTAIFTTETKQDLFQSKSENGIKTFRIGGGVLSRKYE